MGNILTVINMYTVFSGDHSRHICWSDSHTHQDPSLVHYWPSISAQDDTTTISKHRLLEHTHTLFV